MTYLNKKLYLAIGGLAILLGLAVYSKIEENSKKAKKLEIVKENATINYSIEDTVKKYKKDSVLEKKLIPFTHYK